MFSVSAATAINTLNMTHCGALIGGVFGLPAPVSFSHWQAPKHGNISELIWNTAFKGAQLSIAIAASNAQQQIADKQMDLAESWYSHASYKWSRFKNGYMPLEKQLLREVAATKEPKLDCKSAESRADISVSKAYDVMRQYMDHKTHAYHLCMDDGLLTDYTTHQNMQLVDSRNYNYDDDRWWKDYQSDKRWNRRSQVLNIGRNTSATGLEYGKVANRMYGQISGQLDQIGGSAMQALGYFGTREDTYAPAVYLGTGGRGGGQAVAGVGKQLGNLSATQLNASMEP